MVKEVAQAIVGINKAHQAYKTVKRGVQNVQRSTDRSPKKAVKTKQPTFKNIRTPSNTPGGMKGWQQSASKKASPKKEMNTPKRSKR